MDRLPLGRLGLTALVIGAAFFALPAARTTAAASASCKDLDYRGQGGVEYRILFARNAAVQQYLLVSSSHNPELDNDVRVKLERRYGQEAVNAPPLKITSFRKGEGAMMVPDKAIDSCGRITHFH
ncbi:MAG TPA: hypothetical protein VIG32_12460 [Candidatus Baltobacteraceae bacterium]|jgi:hypothetical protein